MKTISVIALLLTGCATDRQSWNESPIVPYTNMLDRLEVQGKIERVLVVQTNWVWRVKP